MVNRAFRYRLLPSKTQAATLERWFELGRVLYNAALQERRDAWRKQRVSVSRYDQAGALAEVRASCPEYAEIPIVVQRAWIRQLDKSFKAFFRRCKAGEKPGYPRFKSKRRFNTIGSDDLSRTPSVVAGGRRVHVTAECKIRFRMHRPIDGAVKAWRIMRDGDRWWIVFFCSDVPVKLLPASDRAVGVDLGLTSLVATSDGVTIAPTRAYRASEQDLKRAQRRVSRRVKGSKRRRRAVAILRRKHAHVANVRREAAIQIARSLVRDYDTIAVEDLQIKNLCKGVLAKPIYDAAWGILLHWIRVKAEEAGCTVIAVDPRNTSQECSICGAYVFKELSVRVHRCPRCGYVADRDVNAARNVYNRAVGAVGERSQVHLPSTTRAGTDETASV